MPVRDLLSAASGASVPATYIEDVFSTYLYTGNGSTQTITNGIDLAGKGGLVWIKDRASNNHNLFDTERTGKLYSNSTLAESTGWIPTYFNFTSSGFQPKLGDSEYNQNGSNYASWTFRKQPKFFDVVTYTGNGAGVRSIPHSLGTTAALTFLKKTNTTSDWIVNGNFASLGIQPLYLNSTAARDSFNQTGVLATDDNFVYVGASTGSPNFGSNDSGVTYVVYLFASNAGGFGLTGTDNVISCGSFTGNGSGNATVNLGYEPQFLLVKLAQDFAEDWRIFDTMRGWDNSTSQGSALQLVPNSSAAETTRGGFKPTATGFEVTNQAGGIPYIYMAIRRPMKVPTDATTVFKPITSSDTTGTAQTTGFPIDLQVAHYRVATYGAVWADRLRGVITTPTNATSPTLLSSDTSAESTALTATRYWDNTSFQTPTGWSGNSVAFWNFRRAPGFFDEVCYTGTGSATTVNHNLGVAPELIIVKNRNNTSNNWCVYNQTIGNTKYMYLNDPMAADTFALWNNTSPTSSVFSVAGGTQTGASGYTYVAYLFATCPGVSKVGSYTGNGGTQAISCGFTGGARFVLIKRTDSTGDWYVYDTARGMTTLVDPYLLLNSTAAESATLGSVTTTAGGFTVNASILAAINTSGASYIFLAIA